MRSFLAVFLALCVVVISSLVNASPTPQQQGGAGGSQPSPNPTGTSPAPSPTQTQPPQVDSPSAWIKYWGDGWAQIENTGVPPSQVGNQCRGLAGTLAIQIVIINIVLPSGGPAYGLQFYDQTNCQGTPVATTSGYQGNGPLRGTNGQVVYPKSARFVLLQ